VLDHSGSVGSSNWQFLLDFMARFVSLLDIGQQATRVSVITFGKRSNQLHCDINASKR